MAYITPLRLGFMMAGCVLGAGFVSGQELYQFFSSYGPLGIVGFIAAMLLLGLAGVLIMRVAQIGDIFEMDGVIVTENRPFLRFLVGAVESLMLFGIYIIMVAGVGSMTEQLFGIPPYIAAGIFCLVAAVLSANGIAALSRFFSLCVPILTVVALGIALTGAVRFGGDGFSLAPTNVPSFFFPHFSVSSVLYVSYSILGAIGILVPVAARTEHKKTVWLGMAIGAGLLTLVGGSILLALAAYPEALSASLPMLALASALGTPVGYIYAVLLLLAMLGAALSCLGGVCVYLKQRLPVQNGYLYALPLSLLAFLSSFFGFGNLISVIYPFFGYLGTVAIVIVLINYFRLKKGK